MSEHSRNLFDFEMISHLAVMGFSACSISMSSHMAYCIVLILNLYLLKTSYLGAPQALMSVTTLEFTFVGNAKGGSVRTFPAHNN